jgi:hypothetical protein
MIDINYDDLEKKPIKSHNEVKISNPLEVINR